MKAIILSAGQGKRLLPHTAETPKCLLPLGGGMTLLGWQLRSLADAGFDEAVIVTGFHAEKVEAEAARYASRLKVRTLHNPFYGVADNLGSVWLAREEIGDDAVVLNGDTLFVPDVARRIRENAKAPITLTIAKKARYDADDMKVALDGERLTAVSKMLPPERAAAESIGMMRFRGEGARAFRQAVEEAMRDEAALKRWYLSGIDSLAASVSIGTVEAAQSEWCEIDFPADYDGARERVAAWEAAEGGAAARLAV